jgi:hypothetical protein
MFRVSIRAVRRVLAAAFLASSCLAAAAPPEAFDERAAVTGAHYEGGHWLGTFAAYLATRRGIAEGAR